MPTCDKSALCVWLEHYYMCFFFYFFIFLKSTIRALKYDKLKQKKKKLTVKYPGMWKPSSYISSC